QLGIDRARARLDYDTDVLRRLVVHVAEQRKLALVDQLAEPLDQPPLLHLPWDFRDHDDVGAAPGLFLVPARPHAEGAAAGDVGFRNLLARIDDEPAGRKIGAWHVFQQRAAAR